MSARVCMHVLKNKNRAELGHHHCSIATRGNTESMGTQRKYLDNFQSRKMHALKW